MMFTDTHAHLCWPEFTDELPVVIARAQATGVTRIVSIGTDLETSRQTLSLAQRFPGVFAAVGLHPGDVSRFTPSDTQALRHFGTHPRVVAIGETGLDYYRLNSGGRGSVRAVGEEATTERRPPEHIKQTQKDLLWAHLALAKELHKPVIIHNRDANADLLEILCGHEPDFRPWGVMHCFSGDEKFACDCLELGLLISYTGILTFKNAELLRAVANAVSLDHVLLETDCPYLAPVPHRGQRNEPAYIPLIAQTLAAIKGVPVEEVAAITTRNAERLFRFP